MNRPAQPELRLSSYFPILEWGRSYGFDTLTDDLLAAVIVTIMLVPQALDPELLDRPG